MAQATPGDELRVALVVESGREQELKDRADEYGFEVNRELPSGVVLVTMSGEGAEEFVSSDLIRSVSRPDRMKAQA